MNRSAIYLALAGACLAGCGGSNSPTNQAVTSPIATTTPVAVSAPTPEGLWSGTTSTGRAFTGIITDTGTTWTIYSAIGNSGQIGGVIQGTVKYTSSGYVSGDGRDFNLEGLGVNTALAAATYFAKNSFTGTITYPSGQVITATATYDPDYETIPALATIAGSYTGSTYGPGIAIAAALSVDASGAIKGTSATGCSFTGHAAPHARGNFYDISITAGPPPCPSPNALAGGIFYFSSKLKKAYAIGLNNTRTDGFVFIGSKN